MNIRFYYDVVCPYAYLASTRVEAVARQCGANVTWIPVLLGGLFRHVKGPQVPAAEMSAPRARLNLQDMHRCADRWGVPLTMPDAHPRRTVSALRLILGAPAAAQVALARDLFAAYWVRGEDVADRAVLATIGARHGVDIGVVDDPQIKQALFDTTAEAADLGGFGVPIFGVEDRMFWGQDRLDFVAAALGHRPEPSWPTALPDTTIRFFHDLASPWSYLASTQIERFAATIGARVEWAPILLGGLFRAIGTPDVPLHQMNAAKQRYVARDLKDWAAWWGVPLRWPRHFPMRSILPLRAIVAEPAAAAHLYRAAWAEDRRIDTPEDCAAVLSAAGFDARAVLERTRDPAVKALLRTHTEAAQAAGACGVPSFVVESPERSPILIWGQDRLDMVAQAAAGWRPRGEA